MNSGKVELGALQRYIPEGSTTIDVGSNVGDFSRRLSDLSQGGMVLAFEPQSMPRSVMTVANFFKGKKRIMVFPMALGDEEGMVTLKIPIKKKKNVGVGLAHIGSEEDFKARFDVKKELVQVTRLDTVLERIEAGPISFIKIDVEGCELKVLRGAVKTIETHRPVVLCEIDHDREDRFGTTTSELLEFFQSRDYCVRSIATHEILPRDALERNVVFTPNSR